MKTLIAITPSNLQIKMFIHIGWQSRTKKASERRIKHPSEAFVMTSSGNPFFMAFSTKVKG